MKHFILFTNILQNIKTKDWGWKQGFNTTINGKITIRIFKNYRKVFLGRMSYLISFSWKFLVCIPARPAASLITPLAFSSTWIRYCFSKSETILSKHLLKNEVFVFVTLVNSTLYNDHHYWNTESIFAGEMTI